MSKSQINLRGDTELKNKLSEIAKKKDTSLNEVSIQALTEFAKNYELDQVRDDDIPSAEQATTILEKNRAALAESYRNYAKSAIQEMLSAGEDTTIIDLFYNDNNLSNRSKASVADKILAELKELGYYTYIFSNDSDSNCNYSFRTNDIGISLDKMGLHFMKEEDNLQEIPF